MAPPKPLPDRIRRSKDNLDSTLADLRRDSPQRFGEQVALAATLLERAKRWETEPIRVPPGTELVEYTDAEGRLVYTVKWNVLPSRVPEFAVNGAAVAVELAWTVYRLDRPWEITDERLQDMIANPPAPPARIFGDLLAIRFAEWIRIALANMSGVCLDNPPPQGYDALEGLFRDFADIRERYDARTSVTIHGLTGLLDLPEANGSMTDEYDRWRWMLLDYAEALDSGLHAAVLSLDERLSVTDANNVGDAWSDVIDRRRLDACTGLLLAKAVANDPDHDPRRGPDFVDPMATRAVGSMAWWCKSLLMVLEEKDKHPLGDRLTRKNAKRFAGFSLQEIGKMDRVLTEALVRVFPAVLA